MARLSWNVSSGGRSHTSCWRLPSTRAMRRLNAGPPLQGAKPATATRPLVGYSSPASILSVVVLPAPLGPRNPTISPGSMAKVTSRTAWTSRYRGRSSARSAPLSPGSRTLTLKVLLSRSAVMAGGIAGECNAPLPRGGRSARQRIEGGLEIIRVCRSERARDGALRVGERPHPPGVDPLAGRRERGTHAAAVGRVGAPPHQPVQIGRASCRGRGEISVVGVSLKKKKKTTDRGARSVIKTQ